jgi:hypothetical protein
LHRIGRQINLSGPRHGSLVDENASEEPGIPQGRENPCQFFLAQMPIRLRLSRNLSSADAKIGDLIDFEGLDQVKAGDMVAIERGATAIGSVTDAEKKSEWRIVESLM